MTRYILVNNKKEVLANYENLLTLKEQVYFMNKQEIDNVNTYLTKESRICYFNTIDEARRYISENKIYNVNIYKKVGKHYVKQ